MNRNEQLLESITKKQLDAILLIKDANLRYISGFTGSESYLLVSKKGTFIFTDGRYTEQAENECKNCEVIQWQNKEKSAVDAIMKKSFELGVKRLGFEEDCVTYQMYDSLKKHEYDIEIVPTKGIVENIRCIKNEYEIECIRKAASFADIAFNKILNIIKPGMTENELTLELEYNIRKAGSQGVGFETILISGQKTSMPHGIPSDKKIEYGDFITMDFGGIYNGYRSDMTRTIVVGKANQKQKEIYNVVKEAQARGVEALADGVTGKVPDDKVREVIEKAGYIDKYYTGLGHGVGLEIHEQPFMGYKCKDVLKAGFVVTMEPGIYLPGWGGVRIEDTVLITKSGNEILTKSDKNLIEI